LEKLIHMQTDTEKTVTEFFQLLDERGGPHYTLAYLQTRIGHLCEKIPGFLEGLQSDIDFIKEKNQTCPLE